jgi:predicted AAA+ superfamily ATPase
VVVVTGPRQVGKTSLVQAIRQQLGRVSVYLDLERPQDLAAIDDLEYYCAQQPEGVIIFDEVQRKPSMFPELRSIIDRDRRPGRFILLGSASFDLIRDTSETLAGRVALLELHGLRWAEVSPVSTLSDHWIRGGFPDALLAPSNDLSFKWRNFFIRTYLERDLHGYGLSFNPVLMRRLLTMLAHVHGNVFDKSSLSGSLEVDAKTVERYVSFLEQTLLVRRLPPYFANLGKRLVKRPKVYLRDSGILHALLNLPTGGTVLSHPVKGNSFEGYVLEELHKQLPFGYELCYYRTQAGAEIDVVVLSAGQPVAAIEIKSGTVAKIGRGFHAAAGDLKVHRRFVVVNQGDEYAAGGDKPYRVIAVPNLRQVFS